jgi:hypothetical protein
VQHGVAFSLLSTADFDSFECALMAALFHREVRGAQNAYRGSWENSQRMWRIVLLSAFGVTCFEICGLLYSSDEHRQASALF